LANEISLKFGSTNISDGPVFAIEAIDIDENKTIATHKIPITDGSIAETALRESLTINLKGSIAGSTYDGLRTNIDTLKAALQDGLQKFTLDDDRYIMAQLKSFKKSFIKINALVRFQASFIAHFPFWLAELASSSVTSPTSGVGYTVNNAGNAPTRVKILITAAGAIADNCKIENTTNSEAFQYRGTIAATKILEIDNRYDTDDFEVLNNGADDHTNFQGDFITLEPGDNTILYTGVAGPTVALTYRNCWY
jgi:phage-related protein